MADQPHPYDPILFTNLTPPGFHRQAYAHIAGALRGCTRRSMISILDLYAKTRRRLEALEGQGLRLDAKQGPGAEGFAGLMRDLAEIARDIDMQIVSCAEEIDLRPCGIQPGKCVDDDFIPEAFGLEVTHKKNPGMRAACGCVESRDIGMYDSCLFGCQYCYATNSFAQARLNHARHDPESPSLLGRHEPRPNGDELQLRLF